MTDHIAKKIAEQPPAKRWTLHADHCRCADCIDGENRVQTTAPEEASRDTLALVNAAFQEVAFAFPEAYKLAKVQAADKAVFDALAADPAPTSVPSAPAAPGGAIDAGEQEGNPGDEAVEIIGNLIDGIEKHGMYSKESTLMSLTQAYYSLRPQNPPLASSPSSAPAESGWQPIETAPKDGSLVLIGYDGGSNPYATNAYVHSPYVKPKRFHKHFGWLVEPLVEPTHWMPLPAAPQAVQAGAAEARGIYVASRASIPERPMMWQGLRLKGWPIVSTWIDEAEEGETEDFGELWQRIRDEIASSAGVLLYAEGDDFPLKGALIECGIALGMGKPVATVLPYIAHDKRRMKVIGSWVAHPNVRNFELLEQAKEWLLSPTKDNMKGGV